EVKNFDVGIYSRDTGTWSREFMQRLAGSPNVRRVVSLPSPEAARAAINNQSVIAVVMFDDEFSSHLAARRPAIAQAILDGRRSNAAQIVSGYPATIAAGIGAELTYGTAAGEAGGSRAEIINWFNPNLDYLWFAMPALIVVISMVSGLALTAQSVARE